MRLHFAGLCVRCSKTLAKGAWALYQPSTHTVRCIECQDSPGAAGVAGASSMRTYEKQHAARQARVRNQLGNILGNVALALKTDPQSTSAWAKGARGEKELAHAVADIPSLKVLHDRGVLNSRGNIDHLFVGPAGVFVVDAKNYRGVVQVRDVGGLFHSDLRLFVGRWDRTRKAENMQWQVAAVRQGLATAGIDPLPPVTPVLCFVGSEWPLLWPAEEFRGVRLESKRSIRELVVRANVLDSAAIDRIYRALATAFPPK